MKPTLITLLTMGCFALGAPAVAQGDLTQMQINTKRALMEYGFRDVDVTALSTAQMAQIAHLSSSELGVASIKGQVGAVLGNSLLKSLFN